MPAIFYVAFVAMWVLLIIQGILLLLVYRHFGLISLGTVEGVQRDGLPVGEKAPLISGLTIQGETLTWEAQAGRAHLVAFVAPECGPCAQILPALNQLAVETSAIEVVFVVAGPQENLERLIEKFHPPSAILCLAEHGSGAMERYRARVTPFAFMIGSDGRILAKGLCDTVGRLQMLLEAGGQKLPDALEVVASSF